MTLDDFLSGAEQAIFSDAESGSEARRMVDSFEDSLLNSGVPHQKRKEWFRDLHHNLTFQKNEVIGTGHKKTSAASWKRDVLDEALDEIESIINSLSEMKTGYRVHHEVLEPGDEVPKSDIFFEEIDEERRDIEEVFEDLRSEGDDPPRKGRRFVFEDLDGAKSFLIRKKSERLFEVEVSQDAILHRGDWNWLNRAMENDPESCARSYWSGEPTENPIWEWIVSKAFVVREIEVDSKERANLRSKIYGQSDPNDIAGQFDSFM